MNKLQKQRVQEPNNSVEVEEMRYQPVLISLKAFFNDEICILSESISMGSWLPSNQLLMAFKRICSLS